MVAAAPFAQPVSGILRFNHGGESVWVLLFESKTPGFGGKTLYTILRNFGRGPPGSGVRRAPKVESPASWPKHCSIPKGLLAAAAQGSAAAVFCDRGRRDVDGRVGVGLFVGERIVGAKLGIHVFLQSLQRIIY